MKKSILFIAIDYPPSESIAEIRASNMVLQLSKNNFEVTVLTLNKNYYNRKMKFIPNSIYKINTIRVNFFFRFEADNILGNKYIPKIIRKIFTKFLPLLGYDYLYFWHKNAIKEITKRNLKFDYVIGTGPPFSNFGLAKKIAKKINSKYILDYRDLWTQSPHGKKTTSNKFNIINENKYINNSNLVVFASYSMQKCMEEKFEIKKSVVLTNGFSEKTFKKVKPTEFDKFTISYVGNFYVPKRIINPFFEALKVLKNNNLEIYNSIEFVYCGLNGDYIKEKSTEYGIEDIVLIKNRVSRNEAFSITKGSNLSLVITSVFKEGNLSDNSIITGKVFEALGMQKRILCIAPEKSDIRKIVSNKIRGEVFNGTEIEEIENFISYEFKNKDMILSYDTDNEEFNWKFLIKKLTKSINEI